jgi:hypothetical protein
MRKISESEAFKAPMCMLFNMSPDPPVGTQLSVRAPLEPIKGRARTLEHTSFTNTQVHKHTSLHKLLSNTTHNGRRILRFGSLNHSKPSCASRVHTPLDQAFLDLPQTHPKLGLGRCTPPSGWRNPPTFGAPGRGSLVCARSRLKTSMPWVVKHHDHLMGEEVASSEPHASRHPPLRVVVCVVSQHAAE